MSDTPMIITISRQLGSGGSYIGRELSKKLGFSYIDKHIVADVINTIDSEQEPKEETDKMLWEKAANAFIYGDVDAYLQTSQKAFLESEIYHEESKIITGLIGNKPAVLVGRGGFYLMRNHKNHIRLFVFADLEKRIENILKLSSNEMSYKKAKSLIETVDKSRRRYIHRVTGEDMHDAKNYDLIINSGVLSQEKSIDLIIKYAELRK